MVARRPRPAALDSDSLAKLRAGLGRQACFYLVNGRFFLSDDGDDQEFDAIGLVIEFFERSGATRVERSFHYLSARFGFDDAPDQWLRRFVFLDRLPIGLSKLFSSRKGGPILLSQVLDGGFGNRKLIAIDIHSEIVDASDEDERPLSIDVDRRVSFVFEDGKGISAETGGGSASAPLYIARAAARPLGRAFDSLTLRAGLRAAAPLNIH